MRGVGARNARDGGTRRRQPRPRRTSGCALPGSATRIHLASSLGWTSKASVHDPDQQVMGAGQPSRILSSPGAAPRKTEQLRARQAHGAVPRACRGETQGGQGISWITGRVHTRRKQRRTRSGRDRAGGRRPRAWRCRMRDGTRRAPPVPAPARGRAHASRPRTPPRAVSRARAPDARGGVAARHHRQRGAIGRSERGGRPERVDVVRGGLRCCGGSESQLHRVCLEVVGCWCPPRHEADSNGVAIRAGKAKIAPTRVL
jgi:hypothetical protein